MAAFPPDLPQLLAEVEDYESTVREEEKRARAPQTKANNEKQASDRSAKEPDCTTLCLSSLFHFSTSLFFISPMRALR